MKSSQLQELIEGAFKYGPFFFSVLFSVFLTRWAYKRYNAAVMTTIGPEDKSVNRLMFLSTFFFGLLLVVISIVWWWAFKPSIYVFRGQIRNLQQQEEIAADVFYLKRERREAISLEDSEGLVRNEHFVILQARPFKAGQAFQLDFSKNRQRRVELWVPYDDTDEEPVYEINYDQASGTPILKRASPGPQQKAQGAPERWLETVYASETSPPPITAADLERASDFGKLATVLRDPRSQIAAKLDAIDTLIKCDKESVLPLLRDDHEEEPFALTLFDLTQHSDLELAKKATLLAKTVDVDGYLAQELSSDTARERTRAERVLLRISVLHARAILARVKDRRKPDLLQLNRDLAAGKSQILKPTASLDGDRYYVKATWDPANQNTVQCLTRLFNHELETTRTLDDEAKLMQGRTQRFVYEYSKVWALNIADSARKCGANTDFVLGR